MSKVGNGSSDHVQQNVKGFDYGGSLKELTEPPKFDNVEDERRYLKERLAAALRIIGRLGFDHHVAGHLTVRDPENPHNFWVNPFGLAMSVMTVSDLILVSDEGKVIGGGKPGRRVVNVAGFLIHSAIHRARPDVVAIVHSHSMYGKAFSTLGEELPITTQDACSFYGHISLLTQFGGVVVSGGEGDLIAKTLGQNKAIILQNHGILTAGQSIDSALNWFVMLEAQCQVALLAKAAGTPVLIDEAQTGSERSGYFMGESLFSSPLFQQLDDEVGDAYKK
ncbi:BZ3500_MvSof-1268-A1-R1_Chr1-1g01012 [Microbotryum saponariae]|uniref:BZ3500_MvSof-1268-A1-R1_Chr1-1g01012 protein n=1 Tax=Microbotryum saponariae TaxID=289078 RepID=A0A2X0K812_9BASI|nr:BZ3500_MvSof-1268-A1-R1_Chr1-1g01012 [Microbotryum saponariae]SCZ93178.1 BZ3501_MvSof-1269-A2-R1_Chr1-1g00609 [Microbotryum saponariae]